MLINYLVVFEEEIVVCVGYGRQILLQIQSRYSVVEIPKEEHLTGKKERE